MLNNSIHLKIAGFIINVLDVGRPKCRAKVGWALPEPEIGYLEPETLMQGTFDHGEQFRSHKDATLHYEDFEWQRPNEWAETYIRCTDRARRYWSSRI
ncbi:predicted protein [Lichtheimia corymbifera JMRC:FSU:9682]|uniref:Uncharacterized protein n=1 Tax=Lichtheimia corymbifera JMRC:FSU:9682 TaxID=1263082 RepID=A0A068SH55_9FUNG|nr:predicted protein [Lichtheimia corymbifera JMRC:FSU:9682]